MKRRQASVARIALALVLAIVCLNLAPLMPVHAAGIVSTCDLPSLTTALAGGGVVLFTCSGTIIVTPTITIAADTKIDATGQNVTLSGNGANTVFIVNSGVTLSLVHLIIANGLAGSAAFSQGGGVLNNGTLNVVNSTFTGNSAGPGANSVGGGIYSNGPLNVINSTFSGNSAPGSGGDSGGIFSLGPLNVVNSTFSGNSAVNGGTGALTTESPTNIINSAFSSNTALGTGGVDNHSTLNVINSAFSANTATSNLAGAIGNEPGATLNVVNSTFSGNSSSGEPGGGIFNNGTLNMVNSTFSGNSSVFPVGGGGGVANISGTLNVANSTFSGNSIAGGASVGAVYNASGGTMTMRNTIVTNSTGADCGIDSGTGSSSTGNNNLSDGSCPSTTAAVSNFNTTLANNGGPTQTHVLNASSNAIDNVATCTDTSNVALTTDQRGFKRPIGTSCDIGAYEANAVNISFTPTILPVASVGVPYNQPITASGGAGSFTFALSIVPLFTFGGLPASVTSGGMVSVNTASQGLSIFTVRATDSNGDYADWTYGVIVLPASPMLTLAPTTLSGSVAGVAYTPVTITASGGTPGYSFLVTAGTLPTGLTLTPGGLLSGTPTVASTFNFTITATDASGLTGNQAYTVQITAPTITLAPTTLPAGTVGASYNQTITASGGSIPYTFAVTAGSLPPGLNLSSAGVLSGAPTSAGSFTFTVTATDTNKFTGSQSYTLIINRATSSGSSGSSGFTPNAVIGAFDPAISKVGTLQPGGLGLPGEKVTWTISVFDQGTVPGSNVSVVDTVPGTMHVDGADTNQGTFSISGQTVTFSIGTLNPGQTVTLHVVTTVLSGGVTLSDTACVSAATAFALPNPRCASAEITPPTRLPSTGYPPAEPPDVWPLLFAGVGALLIVAGLMAFLLRRRA